MKKLVFAATLSIIGLTLMGCGQTADNETNSSSQATSSSKQQEEMTEYNGTVKEDGSKEEQQLLLSNLKQTNEKDSALSFDEVILLTKGVSILDEKTQEKRLIEEIKAGTTVKVFLVSEPVTTRSLPPQIPGNSIIKILVSE